MAIGTKRVLEVPSGETSTVLGPGPPPGAVGSGTAHAESAVAVVKYDPISGFPQR